jgi:hypothetical protein
MGINVARIQSGKDNGKSYFILSWNFNILRNFLLGNINYRYACIVSHKQTVKRICVFTI